ncbi:cAMP-dependent protein kinase catalytic subunit [Vermiconidia calcicola]|uniref:cAMP-dependent protein kinase catalytic subunit n=1 Tax=Vermiconidia calcicola TaxID=1690605 RepID=A0ACC3NMM6_9PEZI|nr:cAMP-dependent protein kinase catalytic subunit [Vermiconidia calcicola]
MDCMRNGFEEGKLLGGRFRTDELTGNEVAIKCITKSDASTDSTCPAAIAIDDRSEELAIHSRLSAHPNIVNLVNYFETGSHQYMVLELCGNGDLYEAIRVGHGPLETEHVRSFMLELVDAIDHLHSNGVYHRDIKPENIFLTVDGTMKLGDFGLATTETWSTEFAVGSDRYMAPEQYDASVYGYGYSPASADIWAIGIVLLNVLFQRNPFTTPTMKDPLFSDFSSDRQSLFDVFPNMSQDTYNVLVHSLALDPANRSLGAVREALKAAVSFTTDDESLDEFCTEQNDLVTTAAREPLRTPSITSPNMNGDSFPWSSALLKTPQKTTRQLSTIRDDESELFPGSVTSQWQYVDADEASLSSNLDSGLGMSYKSSKSAKSTKSAASSRAARNLVGSLPISFMRPSDKTASPYGGNGNGFSKSWSDLWDEEEEMVQQGRSSFEEAGMSIDRVDTAKPSTPQLRTITEDDHGSATPRPVLAEADVNRRSASPLRKLIEHDKANPESSKQRSTSILDKWAALGTFRRAKQETSVATATPTPQKTKYSDAFSSFTSLSDKKPKPTPKTRDRSASWRQGSPTRLRSTSTNRSQVWERKDSSPTHSPVAWEADKNWRSHKPPVAKSPSPPPPPGPHSPTTFGEPHETEKNFLDSEIEDNDVEWIVGGWKDFYI